LTPDSRLQTPDSLAAIVLAAGRSERMGAFKPLLPFGDKTVVDHCLGNLRKASIELIVVVLGHRAGDLKSHLENTGVIFAVNPDVAGDMSSSIACGVRTLPSTTKAVIITPVDYPAVSGEVVLILIEEWKKGERFVKPTWNGTGGHPVLVDLKYRDELLNLNTNLGLKGLFEAHRNAVKRVAVESPYIARDIDTWDDYEALHEEVFGFPPPIATLRHQSSTDPGLVRDQLKV
jgi:molybdenum cofactor cytidylyltransferase